MERKLRDVEAAALRTVTDYLAANGRGPSVRAVAKALGYSSPRSAMLVLNRLIEAGYLRRRNDRSLQVLKNLPADESRAETANIPLVGNVACGSPLLADENVEGHLPVSKRLLQPGTKHFLLRAIGDSMNAVGIDDGSVLLVRQQSIGENGQNVVAIINDEATVKEFQRRGKIVVLKPRSTNPKHMPIVLSDDFLIQGIVVAVLPQL